MTEFTIVGGAPSRESRVFDLGQPPVVYDPLQGVLFREGGGLSFPPTVAVAGQLVGRVDGLTFEVPPAPPLRLTSTAVALEAEEELKGVEGVVVEAATWRDDGVWIRCAYPYSRERERLVQAGIERLEERLEGSPLVYLDAVYGPSGE